MTVPDAPVRIRPVRASDYRTVISVIDGWWGGRHMADMLPRLFFRSQSRPALVSIPV